MSKNYFIVIEGPDGAGASTQIERVAKNFEDKGRKVHLTKEPTNNVIGGIIRGVLTKQVILDPYALQLLFTADRAQHLKIDIEPALAQGFDVLTDRYLASTVVFGHSEAVPWDRLYDINSPFRVPDATLILNVDPATCVQRIYASRPTTERFEKEETLRNVVANYLRFAEQYPNTHVIDAEGDTDTVERRVITALERILSF